MSTKTVIAQLNQLIAPLGFVRRKTTWNRESGSLVDVIDIQVSKAGDAVTASVGILDRGIHEIFWGDCSPELVEEPHCTVRARIGDLVEGKDIWWQLNDSRCAADLVAKISSHGLPFLERTHTAEAIERHLADVRVTKRKYPPDIINLAILRFGRGDKIGACTLLTKLQKSNIGAWRARVGEIIERLGCL
ncbi:DUF4304 domain-containing protein [Bradyrhizobium sp. 170]|nr:DUF4304 domain-containing protein [Bradyrhizobium sp. 170]